MTLLLVQVSNQCMALVRDDCLVPTLDAPELGYIRESTSEQYVPDVFYKVHCLLIRYPSFYFCTKKIIKGCSN